MNNQLQIRINAKGLKAKSLCVSLKKYSTIFMSVLVLVFGQVRAFADTSDTQTLFQENIGFFDSCGDSASTDDTTTTGTDGGDTDDSTTPDTSSDCGACTTSSGPADGDVDLTGNSNVEKAWNYLREKGLSDAQAAGVVGNFQDESTAAIDPEVNENGSGDSDNQPKTGGSDGWGIAQWTYPSQDVESLLDQYNINGDADELSTQLDLVWAQMNGTSANGRAHIITALKQITDPGEVASFFDDNFEGGDPGDRVTNAEALYANRAQLDSSGADDTDTSSDDTTSTTPTSTSVSSDTLDGHKLPATVGGTGDETAITSSGQLVTGGGTVSFPQFASMGKNYQDYYITMRWRYQLWNWDGTSTQGPEDGSWYGAAPRKVLVTNPRNGKSIIAVIEEAGPAPWTGIDAQPNDDPKEGWTNPQDGTPSGYTGRVSGFPPTAIQALGAIQTVGGKGDQLDYAWAPDQTAAPGPTTLQAASSGTDGSGDCGDSGTTDSDGSNAAIVEDAEAELKLGLQGTGPLNDGGPVCKYEGSSCPQAWCADFVSWIYNEAGKPFTGGADGGWRLSLASDTTGYFLNKEGQADIGYGNQSGGDPMEAGWVVGFPGSNPGVRGVGHVGIITKVNSNGTFDDIEGNGSGTGVSTNLNLAKSDAIEWGGYK